MKAFRKNHPDPNKSAFLIMQFGYPKVHREIIEAVRAALSPFGIEGLRADDLEYHQDLLPNVLTYIYDCNFGIAAFERIESERHNPNVALEVGYMMALGKPVCLLKDKNLSTLATDLGGKLYRNFDPFDATNTIGSELSVWIRGKRIINTEK